MSSECAIWGTLYGFGRSNSKPEIAFNVMANAFNFISPKPKVRVSTKYSITSALECKNFPQGTKISLPDAPPVESIFDKLPKLLLKNFVHEPRLRLANSPPKKVRKTWNVYVYARLHTPNINKVKICWKIIFITSKRGKKKNSLLLCAKIYMKVFLYCKTAEWRTSIFIKKRKSWEAKKTV